VAQVTITNAALLGSSVFTILSGAAPITPANATFSGIFVDDPPAVTDTTAPIAPTSLVANTVGVSDTTTQVHITFTAGSDPESGIARHELLNNGTTILDADVVSGDIVTSLVAGTTYNLTVRAVNGAGLTTASSPSVAYTTSGAPSSFSPPVHARFIAGAQGANAYTTGGAQVGDAYEGIGAGANVIYDGTGPTPVTGSKCAKLTLTAGQTAFGGYFAHVNQATTGTTMRIAQGEWGWQRGYAYIPSTFNWNTATGFHKWMRFAGPNYMITALIMGNGNGWKLLNSEVTAIAGTGATEYEEIIVYPGGGIPKDQWITTELALYSHTDPALGKIRFFMNSVLIAELTCRTLVNAGDVYGTARHTAFYNDGSPQVQSMWMDEYVYCTTTQGGTPPNVDAVHGYPIIGDWK
jgi:hypothetical protein